MQGPFRDVGPCYLPGVARVEKRFNCCAVALLEADHSLFYAQAFTYD